MVEVGIPFSDPIADGPVIQAAAQRALGAGVRAGDCLDLIAGFRARHPDIPLGILTYANIVVARGRAFMRDAAEAGADSLLIADVPALEAGRSPREMAQAGIEPVLIAAANTPDARSRASRSFRRPTPIASAAPGSPASTPAARSIAGLIDATARSRRAAAVFGFGISTPEHVRAALEAGAAGVICGSAIVEFVARGKNVTQLIRSLKAATRERLSAAMN